MASSSSQNQNQRIIDYPSTSDSDSDTDMDIVAECKANDADDKNVNVAESYPNDANKTEVGDAASACFSEQQAMDVDINDSEDYSWLSAFPPKIVAEVGRMGKCSGDQLFEKLSQLEIKRLQDEFKDEDSSSENGELESSVCSSLLDMGFSLSQVDAALQSCGETATIATLVYFITEHFSTSDVKKTPAELMISYGYDPQKVKQAIEACGDEEIDVLVDFIEAHKDDLNSGVHQVGASNPTSKKESGANYQTSTFLNKKRGRRANCANQSARQVKSRKRTGAGAGAGAEAEAANTYDGIMADQVMPGYGIPVSSFKHRSLSALQRRPPYFYFENVKCMPVGEWTKISLFFDGIEPEFVDAKQFSVSSRPRGYIHNLPLENRTQLLPIPPMTIREFLPQTIPFTPEWDNRQQLNCINTRFNSPSTFCVQIEEWLKSGNLTSDRKKQIVHLCKKWNLVWIGPECCGPLEPHEVERALGFEENHTRGGIPNSERMNGLGNAFQVDTVGYHLSALKPFFPNGIRVLSLFSGIGGAEVALHRAGIELKFVVSVEKNAYSRAIINNWWVRTGQRGTHIVLEDVQDLSRAKLGELLREAGGAFDLVIGGSPCNNLSGNNRSTRVGLAGEASSMFYEFPRIINLLRDMMVH